LAPFSLLGEKGALKGGRMRGLSDLSGSRIGIRTPQKRTTKNTKNTNNI
jgi:hypothetical protein